MAEKILDQNETRNDQVILQTNKDRDNITFQDLVDITERNDASVEVYIEEFMYRGNRRKIAVEVDEGEIYRAWLLREDEYIEAKVSRIT